ncbi:MAG: transglycosylase domain-containing protein, partial [Mycoplasmatales bacterium]
MSKKIIDTNDLDTLDNIIENDNTQDKLVYFDDILPILNQELEDDKTIILNDKNESNISKGEVMSKTNKKRNAKKHTKKKTTWKKKNKKQKAVLISKVIAIILFLLGIVGAIFCAMFYSNIYDKTIAISPENFFKNNSSVNIYDRNNELIGSLSEMNIDWLNLKDEAGGYNISENYLEALTSIEDDKFYSHKGINIIGLVKATLLTLFTDNDRGGSTLTMQIGKLLYMNEWLKYGEDGLNQVDKKPIEYKVTQMAYARKIEKQFSKDQILESYVNSIYFGEGGYGIKNASLYYFGVNPKDLSIAQGAVLAGMTQLPSTYNPYKDPALVTERRNLVLGRMLELEKITQAEYDEAMATDLTASLVSEESHVVDTTRKYTAYLDVV